MKKNNCLHQSESVSNIAETNYIIEKIHVSSEVDVIAKVMKEEIRNNLNRKIDKSNQRTFWLKTISVAASFAIIAGIFATYYFSKNLYSEKNTLVKIEAGKNEKPHFSLPDGTKVYLNSNSVLIYPCKFDKNRKVNLIGEAYFEVTHDKKSPFIVQSGQVKILVYGTKFNVQSYNQNKNVEVTLLEGSVGVNTGNSGKETHLLPGQQAVYDKLKNQITQRKVDTEFYTSWVNKDYNFNEKTFAEIATTLEQRFNIKIKIESEKLKSMKFTGEFKSGDSLKDILDIITFDKRIEYEINQDIVYIRDLE